MFNPAPNTWPKVMRFVQVASALSKRAMDQLSEQKQQAEKAASLSPSLLTLMIDTETIGQGQQKQAEAMLGSHEQTLVLLKSAVEKIAELKKTASTKSASDLGSPTDDPSKQAQDDVDWSLSSPFVGQKTSEKKASDAAMLAILDNPA